jgi:hypothetical protein
MKFSKITEYRLANQYISNPDKPTKRPEEVLAALGAMQAQDYNAALWAIGLRLQPNFTKARVEESIAKRHIIRTWPMRYTLHFVLPNDVRWMLGLYREQKIPNYQKRNGLNELILKKGLNIIANAFNDKRQLTSKEIYGKMESSKIPVLKIREVQAHILRRAGRDGIVCYASRDGKQHTFALLDDWVPKARQLDHNQAVAELASRYFSSHGPATIKDYLWWSGLRVADAKAGIENASPKLVEEEIEGKRYYMPSKIPRLNDGTGVHLLPAFDEYLVGYSDRSAMLGNAGTQKILRSGKMTFVHSNGIFLPTVIVDGQVVGTWRSVNEKKRVAITIKQFLKLNKEQMNGIREAAEMYGKFLETPVVLK